jgi:hypothetical protein
MRNFAILGASALVIALGVSQAFAIPTTDQWQNHLDRMNPSEHSASFQDFRAQAADPFIGATVGQAPSLYHRGR